MTTLKPLWLTTGEPAGIGPDIALMLLADAEFKPTHAHPMVLLGDWALLQARAYALQLPLRFIRYVVEDPSTHPTQYVHGVVHVLDVALAAPCVAGQLSAQNSAYVLHMLQLAGEAALSGQCAGIVTAPVQKSIINDAGIAFSGHTEFFQHQAGVPRVVMMLATHQLRVALVTTHLPLKQVPEAITTQRLHEVIDILLHDLRHKFGIAQPHIKVCGLNPHAGEDGHLGTEEINVINPVLARYQAQGVHISSALPADTLFTPHNLAGVDAVLAMYHDQGLPVLKAQGFGAAVNITLGLPYVRTSVDHGTALSLAGTGKAHYQSLGVAVEWAGKLAASSV